MKSLTLSSAIDSCIEILLDRFPSYINFINFDNPLDVGKRYAFRVIAKDTQGRDVFRNHGVNETAYFFYGYPEGGRISLTNPPDSGTFSYTTFKRLEWNAADNLIDDKPVRYNLRVAQIADGFLAGKVTVLGCGFAFNMEMKKNV